MKMQTSKDYPMLTILVVWIMGATITTVIGTTYQMMTDTLPIQRVTLERTVYDGAYEKHVELVEYEYRSIM